MTIIHHPQYHSVDHEYATGPFIKVHRSALEALGTIDRCLVFEAIRFRSEQTGTWRASMAEIARVAMVSYGTARRVTKWLRDQGLVQAERSSSWDSTLIWSVDSKDSREVQDAHPEVRTVDTCQVRTLHTSPSVSKKSSKRRGRSTVQDPQAPPPPHPGPPPPPGLYSSAPEDGPDPQGADPDVLAAIRNRVLNGSGR